MTYTLYYAALFSLWPIVAFAGGQGFTAMLGLACLPALPLLRPSRNGAVILVAIAALVLWISISAIWSPVGGGLVSGSIVDGTFGVNAASVRIGLTALAGIVVIAVLNRPTAPTSPATLDWITAVILVHLAILLLLSAFTEQALDLFHGLSNKHNEAIQNITRNANAFALALPVLAAMLIFWRGNAVAGTISVVLIAGLTSLAFHSLGAHTAAISPLLAILAGLIVFAFGTNGFKVLFGTLAALLVTTPLVFRLIVTAPDKAGLSLPGSFQSRIWSWEAILGKIGESPWIGHGLGAVKSWRETYADHPEKLALVGPDWTNYPVIPGHPHNMALHIWSETGLIGALLSAGVLIAIGFSLPSPKSLPANARYAAAGLVGAATVAFSVSYSAWNDAYWASLTLLAGVIIIMARSRPRMPEVKI